MLIPKLSPKILYRTISPLIMGCRIAVFHINPITSKLFTYK
jgi:hypothetical protein